MKMISRIAGAGLGLMVLGSQAFAQSLADAKKAIDAEQYQKAKSMLKNLTTTQADKDENYFYLGWVYLKQDDADSAKTFFNKGLAVNPKSALNMVGLGAVAHIEKDNATATNEFNQAIAATPKKDSKPYLYIGLSYLLPVEGSSVGVNGSKISAADADAALAVLQKGAAVDKKDAEILVAMGDAYRSQLKSTDAYTQYSNALAIDPKLAAADVAIGVLWRYAENFDASEDEFKKALAIDPNYGPAYREWAETNLRQAPKDPTTYQAKVKQAADNYKKYISLTDYSPESQMRYADFVFRAKDFTTLQKVATDLSSSQKSNLRVYRYLGYAAYENKDYPAAETALTKWINEADKKRLIPADYLYLGKTQLAEKKDSLGIQNLRTALTLDTTQVDLYGEIAGALYQQRKYADAAKAYNFYGQRSRSAQLQDHYKEGYSWFEAYKQQYVAAQKDKNAPKPDSTYLIKADSAFAYVERKVSKPIAAVVSMHAQVKDFEDGDRNDPKAFKGLAKPLYEQYIQITTASGTVADKDKEGVAAAYAYLGNYAEYKDNDHAKALDYFNKAKDLDPNNPQVVYYFQTKGKAAAGAKSK
ncbi:tetratricopeptide repeat protein [Mucilaginibacter sp. L3T2-6]|uniref:tetratricopeptide repeat protein n=1 Tax=Mucilaginibacter sp. L3T2-6 TaxID=3062491 RepID=UPI0026772A79|nr:tetratricopeptide repeat protein [Mucilaginibacter sp. L3T2-6]MDO3640726.1 tetratricopeptide repeat protein [Mucilaginibacter sp. L3T2-6]MDV6212933.1 tetratricopeptide repeat protein [Mucilaginibacter sp. L3T2-6]